MASMSGVELDPEVNTIVVKIATRKMRFHIFKLSDDNKNIVTDAKGCEEENCTDTKSSVREAEENTVKALQTIKDLLPAAEPRYVVVDTEYEKEERVVNKLILLSYIPDTAKVKLKMMYSSSKSALTKVLESKSVVDIHVNEADDITNRSAMKAEVLSKSGSK